MLLYVGVSNPSKYNQTKSKYLILFISSPKKKSSLKWANIKLYVDYKHIVTYILVHIHIFCVGIYYLLLAVRLFMCTEVWL